MGTIFLPLLLYFIKAPFLFGYAKPVPVNFYALKNRRFDTALVALAGPFTNFLLAYIALIVGWHVFQVTDPYSFSFGLLKTFVQLNVVLGIFNLLPVPPLDGGRVLMTLLPGNLFERAFEYDRYGMIGLLSLMFLLPLIAEMFGYSLNLLGWVLEIPVEACITFLIKMAGI